MRKIVFKLACAILLIPIVCFSGSKTPASPLPGSITKVYAMTWTFDTPGGLRNLLENGNFNVLEVRSRKSFRISGLAFEAGISKVAEKMHTLIELEGINHRQLGGISVSVNENETLRSVLERALAFKNLSFYSAGCRVYIRSKIKEGQETLRYYLYCAEKDIPCYVSLAKNYLTKGAIVEIDKKKKQLVVIDIPEKLELFASCVNRSGPLRAPVLR